MARTGMSNLINWTRAKSNAGTAQYSIGGTTYWADDDIQTILDRNRTWVVEENLAWRTQNIEGTTRYFTAISSYKFFEEATSGSANWQVRRSTGEAEGTANYTADYDEGRITWTADQAGTAYTLTGYSYDIYAAAAELVREKIAYIDLWYDFSADAQTFSRSQVLKNLQELAKELDAQKGTNNKAKSGQISFTSFYRSDLNVSV